MKRFLLPASALVLVVTACGAGTEPAPRLTDVRARVPTVPVLVTQRERAALRAARTLEREFVPPPGARRDRAKRDHGGILHRAGREPLGPVANARRFWRVRAPLPAVIAFLRAHDPRAFKLVSSDYGTQRPHYARYLMRTLGWPARNGGRPTRYLDETIAGLPGHTVIRVDASVGWVYPRSPTEIVPLATREIVVRAPKVSRTVTNPARVAQIVRWFDSLPVDPPGIAVACALVLRPNIYLSFRSPGNAELARADVPDPSADICDPIGFKVGGKTKRPLIDRNFGESFARRLERLLGITPKG